MKILTGLIVSVIAMSFFLQPTSTSAATYEVSDDLSFLIASVLSAAGDTLLIDPGVSVGGTFDGTRTLIGTSGVAADVVWETHGQPLIRYDSNNEGATFLSGITFRTGAEFTEPFLGAAAREVTMNNCVIEDFVFTGSATFCERSQLDLTLSNCVFRRIVSPSSGGVIAQTGGVLTASGCVFEGNSSTGNGGALILTEGILNLSDCVFKDNLADAQGALQLVQVTGTMSDCVFQNNQAVNQVGAFQLSRGSDVSLDAVSVLANVALSTGGIILVGNSQASLLNCHIIDNVGGQYPDGFIAHDSSVLFQCSEWVAGQWSFQPSSVVVDDEGCAVAVDNISFGTVKALFR